MEGWKTRRKNVNYVCEERAKNVRNKPSSERALDGFKNGCAVVPKEGLEAIGTAYRWIARFEMEGVHVQARREQR